MHVAILAPGLNYDAGAIPVRARLAGDRLAARGHGVVGYGLELDGFAPASADFPINLIRARKLPSPFASLTVWLSYELALAARLVELDRECGGLDLVVSHWQTYAIAATAVRRNTSARWVSLVQRTIYDIMGSGRGGRNFLMNRLIVRGCRSEFAHSDLVIALHDAMALEIRAHVPQTRRIEVVPNGVAIAGESFEELYAAKAPQLVLYAGRLEAEKCVDVVVRGFAKSARGAAKLVIVGDGPQRRGLERLASDLGCRERVEFTGALPHPEVLAWMKRAAVFVLVSSSEGMPFVLLEAMEAGCSVLCSEIDGNRAILDRADARFVPVGDDDAVASALDGLLGSPPDMRAFGRRSFDRAKRFDWRTIIEQEVRIYEDLVVARTPVATAQ